MFTHIAPLKAFITKQKLNGDRIGFVPTMGALHQGHISLIRQCKAQTDIVVCSIFVNPTQFNNSDDLLKYPRTIEQDMLKLVEAGCDVLFHPEAAEMYPGGLEVGEYNWGAVTHKLEGAFRPGHFDGVITIVKRLFDIVEPDTAYFGQKDFQQSAVVKQLVKTFNLPILIVIGETLREQDGLAMSSRNVRLSAEDRNQALLISKALFYIKEHIRDKTIAELLADAQMIIAGGPGLSIEYLSIVERESLETMTGYVAGRRCVALIAAWCGNVRLIDNMELGD